MFITEQELEDLERYPKWDMDQRALTKREVELFDIFLEVLDHFGVIRKQPISQWGLPKKLEYKVDYICTEFDYAAQMTDWSEWRKEHEAASDTKGNTS